MKNDVQAVRQLIAAGADIEMTGPHRCAYGPPGTAMLYACWHNSNDVVKALLDAGADIRTNWHLYLGCAT